MPRGRGISVGSYRPKYKRDELKRKLVDMLGGKCVDCGYSGNLAALDFDHKEPKYKSFNMAKGLSAYSDNECIMEAHKCELRCANCHRAKTHPGYSEAKDGVE